MEAGVGMSFIDYVGGVFRAEYVSERVGRMRLRHLPLERDVEISWRRSDGKAVFLRVCCDRPIVVVSELRRVGGAVPKDVEEAVLRLADNAVTIQGHGNLRVSVVAMPLSLKASFFDSAGRVVGELRAGSLEKLEAMAGAKISLTDASRSLFRQWTSDEPFWLAAFFCGLPFLLSMHMSLWPHAMSNERLLVSGLAATLVGTSSFLLAIRSRASWTIPLGAVKAGM